MKKLVLLIIFMSILVGCTNEGIDNSANNDVSYEEEKIENINNKETEFSPYNILITAEGNNVRIRKEPDNKDKNNIVGHIYMGEIYTVLEEVKNDEYVWHRIGDNRWVADDGTWSVRFKSEGQSTMPYVMTEDEKNEFISLIDTGGCCLGGDEVNSLIPYLTMQGNNTSMYEQFKCNILLDECNFNNKYHYSYNIDNIVKKDDKSFDIYVSSIEREVNNEKYIDNTTGCFRMTNFEIKPLGDLIDEGISFDLILLQKRDGDVNKLVEGLYNYKNSFQYNCQVSY